MPGYVSVFVQMGGLGLYQYLHRWGAVESVSIFAQMAGPWVCTNVCTDGEPGVCINIGTDGVNLSPCCITTCICTVGGGPSFFSFCVFHYADSELQSSLHVQACFF